MIHYTKTYIKIGFRLKAVIPASEARSGILLKTKKDARQRSESQPPDKPE